MLPGQPSHQAVQLPGRLHALRSEEDLKAMKSTSNQNSDQNNHQCWVYGHKTSLVLIFFVSCSFNPGQDNNDHDDAGDDGSDDGTDEYDN